MIAKSDVVNVRFRYENSVLVHLSIARLPKKTTNILPGVTFVMSVSSDAAPGKEVDMVITSHSTEEKISCRGVMLTAEHANGLDRGWITKVKVIDVKEHLVR